MVFLSQIYECNNEHNISIIITIIVYDIPSFISSHDKLYKLNFPIFPDRRLNKFMLHNNIIILSKIFSW